MILSDPCKKLSKHEIKQTTSLSCIHPQLKEWRHRAQRNAFPLQRKKVIDWFPRRVLLPSIFRNNLCKEEKSGVIKSQMKKKYYLGYSSGKLTEVLLKNLIELSDLVKNGKKCNGKNNLNCIYIMTGFTSAFVSLKDLGL